MLGFTLLTSVLLLIFQLFPVSERSVGLADRTTQANYLARELMETRLGTPYDSLPVTTVPDSGSKVIQHTTRRGSALSTEFTYSVTVEQPDAAIAIRNIRVTVSWKEGALGLERPSSVVLESSRGNLW